MPLRRARPGFSQVAAFRTAATWSESRLQTPRKERALAAFALGLLIAVAELAGMSLTHRIDVGRDVGPVSYAHAAYYPVLVGAVKVGIALLLARVAWRFATARAAYRLAMRFGARPARPRVRVELSPCIWLVTFVVTASIYLVQTDRGLGPWLHSSALPVFAVLAVLVALVYRGAERWLGDYEELAAEALAFVRRTHRVIRLPRMRVAATLAPRSIFGLDFESRPPPAFA